MINLKIGSYFKNLVEEKIILEFRLKNIDETRNYFVEEIDQNELMNNKRKMVCKTIDYIEHFLILVSTVTGRISISTFDSLAGVSIGIMSSAIGLKI